MIVTSSTIGYGDISPQTKTSRFLIILVILCMFAVFTDSLAKIAQVIKDTNFHNKQYKLKNHIVLIGTLEFNDLIRFILPYFDRKGIEECPKILIIGDKNLNETNLEKLIKNDVFS
jgi:hypothetical protein